MYDGTSGGLLREALNIGWSPQKKSSHGPPPDPGVEDFETLVVFFWHRRYRKIGADSTPLTVRVSRAFITVLLARSMTTYHPASSSSHAGCRYELQRLDVGHHTQRSSKCSRRAVRSTGAPHGVPVLIANASDSIAWSLSTTACMDVIETRSVFIGQVR